MSQQHDHTLVVPFAFDGHEVRTVVGTDEEPWFVASDVAKVLGYAEPSNAVRKFCKAPQTCPINSVGQVRHVTIIPERDVYRLIFRSKLPAAERFEEWVVGTVLPTIRKTGGYGAMNKEAVQEAAATAAVAAVKQMLPELIEAGLTRDPRRAVGEYLPSLEIAEREGAPQQRRRGLSQTISKRLMRYSVRHGYPIRQSAESGRYLFHRDAVDTWLRQEGRALIRAHIDRVRGQSQLRLVTC